MDNRMANLKQEISNWVTCPSVPHAGSDHHHCHPPLQSRCPFTAPPPIVNAVDGGEALKCVNPTKNKRAFNILGQPICDDAWARTDELDDLPCQPNTIGQYQRHYDMAKLIQERDQGTYNVIGQKLCDVPFKEPPCTCAKTTVNILGQVVGEYDMEKLGLPSRDSRKCGEAKSAGGGSGEYHKFSVQSCFMVAL